MSSSFGTIIQIGDVLISEEVVTEFFACDYDKCFGACCVVGDSGAPLKEEETEEIERNYDSFKHLMTPHGRRSAESNGFFMVDREGDLVTPVVSEAHEIDCTGKVPGAPGRTIGTPGLEECAFCHFEALSSENSLERDSRVSGSPCACFCSIERSFFAGKSSMRKPVSCSLYPIRVSKMPGGGEALNFHRWEICRDAFEKGRREGIRVYQFLRGPLTEVYGADFYDMLCAAARHILDGDGADSSAGGA